MFEPTWILFETLCFIHEFKELNARFITEERTGCHGLFHASRQGRKLIARLAETTDAVRDSISDTNMSGEKEKSIDEKDPNPDEPSTEEKSRSPEERVSCERKLTEKGKQMCEEEAKRHIKAFLRAYESWKQIAREVKTKLKKFCLKEDLDKMKQHIQNGYDRVNQNYEPLQRNSHSTSEIVRKLDACNTLTTEMYKNRTKQTEERYKNKLIQIIRFNKKAYYCNLLEQNKNDIQGTWRVLNAIIRNGRKKGRISKLLYSE